MELAIDAPSWAGFTPIRPAGSAGMRQWGLQTLERLHSVPIAGASLNCLLSELGALPSYRLLEGVQFLGCGRVDLYQPNLARSHP